MGMLVVGELGGEAGRVVPGRVVDGAENGCVPLPPLQFSGPSCDASLSAIPFRTDTLLPTFHFRVCYWIVLV